MRLKLIKIAGFKSFVETTKLVLASDLVGIVGPNGCGKSNTLDAVRWVMGESSARELRGGDMNDVLFNGTVKRKAVSQCSVELIFDNESGLAGGAYAGFAEISVKRLHHREEGTSYFLNQRKCRRRDVIDLFNGTGLGPRSYALIGQGNISRIIEAKPEDMRVYFEEVAGIGPYRSRRKETLLRLERTRENIAQLAVLQDALTDQAQHLARQAEKAKDYQQAHQRQQVLEKSVYYHQWQSLHAQLDQAQRQLREVEKGFAQSKSAWDEAQKAWLLERQNLPALQQERDEVEAQFHQLDKTLAQLKQQQQFSSQQTNQWLSQQTLNQNQQTQRQQQLDELTSQITQLTEDMAVLDETRLDREEELQTLEENWTQLQSLKTRDEQAQQQSRWQVQQAEQRYKQAQQTQASLQQTLAHLEQQAKLLEQSMAHSESALDQVRIEELTAQLEPMKPQLDSLDSEISVLQHQIENTQSELAQNNQRQTELNQQRQTAEAQLRALEKIQAPLLKAVETNVAAFLNQHSAHTLLSVLKVEPRWQTAVEAWLGARLQGVMLNQAWSFTEDLPNLSFLGWNPSGINAAINSLASQIQQPPLVQFWAQNIMLRDEKLTLQTQLESLNDQAWLIDEEGVLYSKYAIVRPSEGALHGMLERQDEIDQLREQLDLINTELGLLNRPQQGLKTTLNEQQTELNRLQTAQQLLQRDQQRLQDQLEHLSKNQTQSQKTLAMYQQSHAELQQKRQYTEQQLVDFALDTEALAEQLALQQDNEMLANQALSDKVQKMLPIQRERERLQQQLQRIAQQLQQTQQTLHQAQFQHQQVSQQLNQDKLQAQLIAQHLAESVQVDPAQLVERQQQLDVIAARLSALQTQTRELQQSIETKQLVAEQAQHTHHQAEQKLVTHQLQLQNGQQQIQTLQKTLAAQGLSAVELSQLRFDNEDVDQLEAELKLVKLHLARLGAVNMTAIEEYEQVQAKLSALTEQMTDLQASIETLEQAIATIDEDSRSRLVKTFDEVNQAFSELFPKLFQGGEASLSWLDPQQDPLEGGVEVMARPPGKRNSRIQLLSGGEKTLAALALIFAIFQLKPAPFCILDEVDAPLDDSNVIRFCGLVRSLSEKVQFIFITHNKTTMALAKHLIGVTMHEPGVSRLVSVDLEAAVEMIGEAGQ